ncbi:MAG: hypothetical protein ACR2GY_05315 [Phycisphaerales bacterium]
MDHNTEYDIEPTDDEGERGFQPGPTSMPAEEVRVGGDGRLVSDTRCGGCGYNMRGMMAHDRCPRCGRAAALGTGAGAAARDEQGRIAEEIPCKRCGYNLRGLDDFTACPECGTAVGWSIRGDFLRYAAPDWVERLAIGSWWLTAGIVTTLLTTLLSGSFPLAALMFDTLSLAASAAAVVGVWLVTTREVSAIETSLFNARIIARIGMCVGFAGSLMHYVILTTDSQKLADAIANLMVIPAIAEFVGVIALCMHARRLALRIPDVSLASVTLIVMWGFSISLLASTVFQLTGAMATVQASGLSGGIAAAGCAIALLLVAFFVWGLALLFQYRTALSHAAQEARSTWAR